LAALPHLHEGKLLLLAHSPDPAPHFNLLLLLTWLSTAGLHLLQKHRIANEQAVVSAIRQ
jgi:hypothetical protein